MENEPDAAVGARARQYIDPDSKEPLFQQVRRFLEQSLLEGRFRAHRPLPSSRHLAAVLGVSRNTVSAAYQELTSLGLVECRPRSGLYRVPQEGPATSSAPSSVFREPRPATRSGQIDWASRLPEPREGDLTHAATHPDWTRYPFHF
ncbi:MAG: GntR family transcriptional regulator, partial [Demequina sp.]|uniref:GntR family transcriptional regulator n=1 Tax=Demequina sp. TaxID=2050685 RepID=UPI003A8AA512